MNKKPNWDLPRNNLDLANWDEPRLKAEYQLLPIDQKDIYRYWIDLCKPEQDHPLQAARYAFGKVLELRRKEGFADFST